LRLTLRLSAALAGYWASSTAWAMTQCPEEFGEKSALFWAMGWTVLGVFVLTGALMPALLYRATARSRPRLRWALRLASLPAMLAMWLLGFGIFLGRFVLAC